MKVYTVAYIKNGEEYAYETFEPGDTIIEVVEEILYKFNRYGTDYEAVCIFDMYNDSPFHYYEVVISDGNHELVEEVQGGLCVHSIKP